MTIFRQLKRLESTTRSPIYSHFQESIQGATSIRAYECFDRFLLTLQNLVDKNMITYLPSIIANRFVALKIIHLNSSNAYFDLQINKKYNQPKII